MPGIRHWKTREADGEADRGEEIRLRSIAIEAGEVLKTIESERGRSRRHCMIFSLLIGYTEVVLCSTVPWMAAKMFCCVATSIS
jgi:hypothetical protein